MPYREFYRRYLPHWQPSEAALFVTFRLAGSIPQSVIEELLKEREIELRKLTRITDQTQRERQGDRDNRRSFGRWDEALDQSSAGPRWLCQPDIAEIVVEALHYRDGKFYDLLAYCIMPNHVHMVFTVARIDNPGYIRSQIEISANDNPVPLQSIMQSLKRHTARRANIILGRQGAFWQEEYYDHVARDSEELDRIIQYVLNNPVKAGFVEKWEDWRWSYCKPDLFSNDRPD